MPKSYSEILFLRCHPVNVCGRYITHSHRQYTTIDCTPNRIDSKNSSTRSTRSFFISFCSSLHSHCNCKNHFIWWIYALHNDFSSILRCAAQIYEKSSIALGNFECSAFNYIWYYMHCTRTFKKFVCVMSRVGLALLKSGNLQSISHPHSLSEALQKYYIFTGQS